jgi:hypothetical protein
LYPWWIRPNELAAPPDQLVFKRIALEAIIETDVIGTRAAAGLALARCLADAPLGDAQHCHWLMGMEPQLCVC